MRVLLLIDPTWLKLTDALSAVLSFLASLFAAIWALELYQLLRTGAIGKAWKVFIYAAIVFMVHEVCHIARIFDLLEDVGLYEATKLLFVILLAYGFYIQRHVFFSPHLFRAVPGPRRHAPAPSLQELDETPEPEDVAVARLGLSDQSQSGDF